MKFYFLTLGTILVVCVGCQMDGQQTVNRGDYVAPPASQMAHPGPMVDLAAPGIMPMMAGPPARSFQTATSQVRMTSPVGMSVGWQSGPGYAENQLTTPARYNYVQGATYRLKLTNIPDREGLVLYPTLQVYPTHPTTDAYLSHNSIPVELTDEDLDQVESNNFVTKVIYLPDAKYQELAIAGVETLVSTKLQPGVDPVAEAERRGTIMVVLRLGNMDLEMPNQSAQPTPEGAAVTQVSYWADGDKGQHVPPTPIAVAGNMGVPGPMIMGGPNGPGRPGMNPISGIGGTPTWGTPITTTPIGLPGPPHLPMGHRAGLRSHTIRNLSEYDLPEPTDTMRIDVKHNPGIRMPRPVNHIEYTETHPTFNPGEVSRPGWSMRR
jgi:hypothetical protein